MNSTMYAMMVMVGLGFAMSLASLIVVGVYVIGGNGGTEGAAGPTGLMGATGATGSQGPQGEPGNSFIESVDNWLQMNGEVLEVGGLLSKSTALDVDSHDFVLSASGGGTVTVEASDVFMTGLAEDTDASAASVMVINTDTDSSLEYVGLDSLLATSNPLPVVWVQGTDPSTSTVFSATWPPTIDSPALHNLVGYYYCTEGGRVYTSDGATYTLITLTASRATMGNSVILYRSSSSQALLNAVVTTIAYNTGTSAQGPAVIPIAVAGVGYTTINLSPGGIYEVRGTIALTGSTAVSCVYAIYLDGTIQVASTAQTSTTTYASVLGPLNNNDLFTLVQVTGSSQVSLTMRSVTCAGTSPLASIMTKLVVIQVGFL